jgi:hypothetical protein
MAGNLPLEHSSRSAVVGLPPQSVKIADGNAAPTGRYQTTCPQGSERTNYRFARRGDQTGQFLLRQRNVDVNPIEGWPPVFVGQFDEQPRQPSRSFVRPGIDPSLIGSPEPVDDRAQYGQADLRMRVKVGTELFARHRPSVDWLKCNVASGPRATVVIDRFELADQVSRVEDGQDDLMTVSSIQADLDPTAEQDEYGIAVATLNGDRGTASERPRAPSSEQI